MKNLHLFIFAPERDNIKYTLGCMHTLKKSPVNITYSQRLIYYGCINGL